MPVLFQSMKKAIKIALDKLGYAVIDNQSNRAKDLRRIVGNPMVAKYSARKDRFLIEAELTKCIVLFRFNCDRGGNNPLICAGIDYLSTENRSYEGSKLEHYYNNFEPANVAEMFRLDGELHSDLIDLPASLFVYPWENDRMKNKKEFRQNFIKAETRKRGVELPLEHGDGLIGPVSSQRGQQEIDRLVEIIESIRSNRYLLNHQSGGNIEASVLVHGDHYKYLIKDGIHRLSALSALGYEKAPVEVKPTCIPGYIYRDEVEYWPNVKNGVFSKAQALTVFDTIFSGEGEY